MYIHIHISIPICSMVLENVPTFQKSSSFVGFYIPAPWFAHGIYYMEHRKSWGHGKTCPRTIQGARPCFWHPLVVSCLSIPLRIDIPSRSWIHLASYTAINLAIVLGHHLVLNMDEHVDIKWYAYYIYIYIYLAKKKKTWTLGVKKQPNMGISILKVCLAVCVCVYFLRWTWWCHGHNPTSTKKDFRTENRDIIHTWWLAHDGWLIVLRLGV